MTVQKVRIQSIQDRSKRGVPAPYVVRWTVDGKAKARAFTHKTQAEHHRAQLLIAASNAEKFDEKSCEPESWNRSDISVAEYARTWLAENWDTWQPKSRRSTVEGLARLLVSATHTKCPAKATVKAEVAARAEVRAWLTAGLVSKTTDEEKKNAEKAKTEIEPVEMPAWLAKHGDRLSDLSTTRCHEINLDILTKDSGDPMAAATATRQRSTVISLLKAAVEAKHITAVPWPATKRKRTKTAKKSKRVDVAKLPKQAQALPLIDALRNSRSESEGYRVLSAVCYFSGTRPGESRAVHIEKLTLPETGWGALEVDEAVKEAGDAYGTDGEDVDVTKTGEERTVPLPPQLVAILCEYVGDRTSGLLVHTKSGEPVSHSNWARAWRRVQKAGGTDWCLYDLRHAAATTMLSAGVQIGEVARRLGHSPEVLMRHYAGVLVGDEETSNARIEAALGGG
jgi:integrase